MTNKDTIRAKQIQKKKRPRFVRSDAPQKARVARTGWRKPKGLQNKMGDKKQGHRASPGEGYRTPRQLRHHNRDGKQLVRVYNKEQVTQLDKNKHVVILSAGIGARNKVPILHELAKQEISVQHITDPKAHAERIIQVLKDKKQKKLDKEKVKKDKKAKQEKVKSEKDLAKAQKEISKGQTSKKQATGTKDAENTAKTTEQDEDKKELDKLLTQKEK